MKKQNLIAFGVLVLSIVFASCKTEASKEEVTSTENKTNVLLDGTYQIDAANSTANWQGDMLGLYSHSGVVAIKEGSVEIKDGKIVGGNIVVDMKTIMPTDNGYTKDNPKEKLLAHLMSNDFFNVNDFATSTFKITGFENNEVKGDLTVRDKTNSEVAKEVNITPTDSGFKASGKLVFNRQNYGVAFKMPVKDKVLSDDITLNISLAATK